MKLTRQDYILAGGQALLWITLWLIPPAIDFFIRFNPSSAFEVWKINTGFITPLAIVFTANFLCIGSLFALSGSEDALWFDEFAIDHGG